MIWKTLFLNRKCNLPFLFFFFLKTQRSPHQKAETLKIYLRRKLWTVSVHHRTDFSQMIPFVPNVNFIYKSWAKDTKEQSMFCPLYVLFISPVKGIWTTIQQWAGGQSSGVGQEGWEPSLDQGLPVTGKWKQRKMRKGWRLDVSCWLSEFLF